MKKITFILFCMCMGVNLIATDSIKDYRPEQKGLNSFGFKLEGFRSPSLVQYNYFPPSFSLEDPKIYSKSAFGFKGTFNYFYTIHPKMRLGLGLVGGMDSYLIQLVFPGDFISIPDNTLYKYDAYFIQIPFCGINFSVNLDLPIGKRSYIHFTSSISGIHFINSGKVKEASIIAKGPANQEVQIFYANFKRSDQFTLAPGIGFGYAYKVKENMRLQATLNILYTKDVSIQTTEPFTYTNGTDEYHGDFMKEFMHAGFGLELVYSLPNSPKK